MLTLLSVGAVLNVSAQSVRFRGSQVRVTVPINSTITTVFTNLATISTNVDSPVVFSISGLPAGAAASIADTNGSPLSSSMTTTTLVVTLNTTNIAEGIYTYYLNGTGGATNSLALVLQAAHVWNGQLDQTNAPWSAATNWLGGVPTSTSDVVFGELGSTTNIFPGGQPLTNCLVDVDATIGSLRFAQIGITNSIATNSDARPLSHYLEIAPGKTLTVSGLNGFSFLRDYVDESPPAASIATNALPPNARVFISGGAGSRMVVSNANANLAILIGNNRHPSLVVSNLNNLVTHVSRIGLGDFQLYPNYRSFNPTNDYDDRPGQFGTDFIMARTNIITALYKDPNNYTNEFTRAYALTFLNSEVFGIGSGDNYFLYLGQSNAFFLDGVCFIRANHATGNNGAVRFNPSYPDATAIFRSTNNGRMSIFAVSDHGGTNFGNSNMKANIDFAAGNGSVNVLADKLIVARDRTLVRSNNTVNVSGNLTFGRGTIDVNTAILGYQEHVGKTNWYALDNTQNDNKYLGYCQGNLSITNGGTMRVNGTLTLGFTADTNDVVVAQQYDTFGQLNIFSNSTVMVSNIVADGGLNYYDVNGRQNRITINQGTLIVTNSIGGPGGLPLDRLSMTSGTLVMPVKAGQTNIFVRNLINPGNVPSIFKVSSLAGVTAYPTNISLISYETASPFMAADMSSVGGGVQGYIINNTDNQTIDLFLTTNAPKNLVWRGNENNKWNLTAKNWRLVGGSVDTNFSMGDIVTFNDSSTVNSIDITTVVVPNQTAGTNGVTVTNTTQNYTFNNDGGAIAGTAAFRKSGAGALTFNATESGPITILGGTVDGSGVLGATSVGTNCVLNFSGTIFNGLTSTGTVTIASGGSLASGALNIRGGTFTNYGVVIASSGIAVNGGAFAFNDVSPARIDVTGTWQVSGGATLENRGLIKNLTGRLNLAPAAAPFDGASLYGTGEIQDIDGGLGGVGGLPNGVDGRLAINPTAVFSPGATPLNSIGTFKASSRIDLNNTPATGLGVLRIEVDYGNGQLNDIVQCDRWNNITGMILMTNINLGAGTFTNGSSFQIFENLNGLDYPNFIDVNGTYPAMWPPVPAPGLQWGLFDFRAFGRITVTNTPLVWNGGTGIWSTNAGDVNWQGGKSFNDNAGALFDDTASGTTTISLSTNVAPAGFAVTTNVIPNTSTNYFTNGPAMSPGMVVNNDTKAYTIAGTGKITGLTGLYKTGPGTLTILTTNDFTGNTIIDGGTVVITNGLALGVNGNANGVSANNNEVFIRSATLRLAGTLNSSVGRALLINPGDATIDVTSGTNEWTLASITGEGALFKIGPGTLVLNGDSLYQGGTRISNGIVRLTGAAKAGTNTITLAGGDLQFIGNAFTLNNPISVLANARFFSTNNYVSRGPWSGNANVLLSNTLSFSLSTNITAYSGTISLGTNSGNLRFNHATNDNDCLGSAAASFDLGTASGSLSNFNGGGAAYTYLLGSLSGGANTILGGRSSNTTFWAASSIYSIGANGQNTVFSGKIVNGADTVSVVKVGTGRLTLNGVNTYTGSTTVSNGTLGGNAQFSGPLTVTTAGTLAPGSSVGKLTVNNSVTLSGTTIMELDRLSGVTTNDQLVASSIAASGPLIVTNIGPTIFNGSVFKLFSVPVSGFSSTTLPAGYGWNNKLNVDGTIELTSGGVVNTNPPTITSVTTGGGTSLTLTWPASHIGWSLQVQTNTLSIGISNNWSLVIGSSATNTATVGIDPAAPTVFYRLVY